MAEILIIEDEVKLQPTSTASSSSVSTTRNTDSITPPSSTISRLGR